MRPIKARGRADWTDLREGRGRLFQTFLWLTNVAMGFLVIGQKLPLVLKFSLELWSSSFNFPMPVSWRDGLKCNNFTIRTAARDGFKMLDTAAAELYSRRGAFTVSNYTLRVIASFVARGTISTLNGEEETSS